MNLATGCIYIWSVFVAPLEQTFGWNRSSTSIVFTLAAVMLTLGFAIAGRIQDKFGPFYCALTGSLLLSSGIFMCAYTTTLPYLLFWFGAIVGLGCGFTYSTPIPVLAKWFPDKRGLAVGLVVGACGAGPAIFGPFAQLELIPLHGLRFTFQFLGITFLVLTLVGTVLMKNPPEDLQVERKETDRLQEKATTYEFRTSEMMRTPAFYLMWMAYAWGTSAGLMVVSQLVPFAHSVSVPQSILPTLTLIFGALGNSGGRVLSGWLSDKIGRLAVLRMMIGISVIAMPVLYLAGRNVLVLCVAVFAIYWCYGSQISVNGTATSDFWGTRHAGANYGIMLTAWGAAGIVGPTLGGRFFDKYHGYWQAFSVATALAAIAFICELLVKRPKPPGMDEAAGV
jgi:OFA family oxalate/formate antiporter-like MFS transporter